MENPEYLTFKISLVSHSTPLQADKALADKAEENDIKRLEKALVDRE